jgi:hypothetical protein
MKRKVSHYQTVAEIAYGLAKQHLPRYRHKNSPHRFTWPQLSACVLLTFYLDYSYRDMEDWLWVSDRICQVLDLQEIPDHSTLCRAFHKLDIRLLRALQRLLLERMSIKEIAIAVDSTGFSPDQSSAYYSFRNGRPKRDWVKGAYAVGTQSQLILGTYASYGRYQDSVLLKSLRRQSRIYAHRKYVLLADAGLMAGKSSLATLFRLSEDMARCARQTGLSVLNWWRRLVSMVFMASAGNVKRCIQS